MSRNKPTELTDEQWEQAAALLGRRAAANTEALAALGAAAERDRKAQARPRRMPLAELARWLSGR